MSINSIDVNESTYSNIPNRITGYSDKKSSFVLYAEDVTDDEKVDGLTCFIEQVFNQVTLVKAQKFIPIVLDNTCPTEEYINSDEYVEHKISQYIQKNPEIRLNNNSGREILKIVTEHRLYCDSVAGCYYHSGCPEYVIEHLHGTEYEKLYTFEDGSIPYIEIYYRNFECPDENEYMARIFQCVAHELFHFIHDTQNKDRFRIKAKQNIMIKEGLADFYSVARLTEESCFGYSFDAAAKEVAEGRYNLWVDRSGSSWPYAHALYFYMLEGRIYECLDTNAENGLLSIMLDKLCDVLKAHRESIDKAYDILTNTQYPGDMTSINDSDISNVNYTINEEPVNRINCLFSKDGIEVDRDYPEDFDTWTKQKQHEFELDLDRKYDSIQDHSGLTLPLKIFEILKSNSKERNFTNPFLIKEICSILAEEYGIYAERRTVSRHLSQMEKEDYICKIEGKHGGYFYDRTRSNSPI